jgi:hypothetical protein
VLNKEWLIYRVINKLDWWAPHIFYIVNIAPFCFLIT